MRELNGPVEWQGRGADEIINFIDLEVFYLIRIRKCIGPTVEIEPDDSVSAKVMRNKSRPSQISINFLFYPFGLGAKFSEYVSHSIVPFTIQNDIRANFSQALQTHEVVRGLFAKLVLRRRKQIYCVISMMRNIFALSLHILNNHKKSSFCKTIMSA